ncbi:MAG: hypothetical protein ISS14_01690 [Actinobacteria bacterium]|nr:hypothetical protein [Actinomycetota bacterium]
MFKEINDVKKVCKTIISRSDNIKNLATELESLMDEVKSKTSQEEAVNITLDIRKELTNLFILNSNIEDSFNTIKKIFDSLKELKSS